MIEKPYFENQSRFPGSSLSVVAAATNAVFVNAGNGGRNGKTKGMA